MDDLYAQTQESERGKYAARDPTGVVVVGHVHVKLPFIALWLVCDQS